MSRIDQSPNGHHKGEISRREPPLYVRITPSSPTPTNHRYETNRSLDGCNILLAGMGAGDRPKSPRQTRPYERTYREVAPRSTAYTSGWSGQPSVARLAIPMAHSWRPVGNVLVRLPQVECA